MKESSPPGGRILFFLDGRNGKNWRKNGKIGKNRQKSGRFFHWTERASYATFLFYLLFCLERGSWYEKKVQFSMYYYSVYFPCCSMTVCTSSMCSCRMPAKDERKIKFCKNYFVLYVSLISLNFQELFIFMVKGKITMYRIIFFYTPAEYFD